MRKATYLLIITILILITAILIFSAVTTRKENVQNTNPTPSVEPYALLSFEPESIIINSSSDSANQSVDIILDTAGKSIFGAQIELQYDPEFISNISISKPTTSFFGDDSSELINIVSEEEGRITYAVGINPNSAEKRGKGIIAKLTFSVNSSQNGATDITILPISSANNLKDDVSVLKNQSSLPIIINTQ